MNISSKSKVSVILVGCGFLGKATAQLFSEHGYRVTSIVRSESSREELLAEHPPFDIIVCDVTNKEAIKKIAPQLQEASLMIYAVSSGRGNAETYAAVYRDGLNNFLAAWHPKYLMKPLSKFADASKVEGADATQPRSAYGNTRGASIAATQQFAAAVESSKKFIFVSSTSVYAQIEEEVVTESSATEPDRATSRILLEAESIALATGGSVARFSAIYGPGRSVLLKKFLNNEACLENGGDRWINQIHRDDGAQALYHLGTSFAPVGVYNVTDDTPARQREVYQWMSDYFQQPLPPNGPADLNRKRGWTSKRVSNKKLRDSGWHPQFPSYWKALPTLTFGP